jgi:hypothetical protein
MLIHVTLQTQNNVSIKLVVHILASVKHFQTEMRNIGEISVKMNYLVILTFAQLDKLVKTLTTAEHQQLFVKK